ncbi:MAG: MBL fold metallo-hydrolase [Candidatus Omnitrophica bacterium]|nr:MBL fold metallo-hydrolase [Candidatus Omnitrophota bacterium]MBU0896357.1 MBL fold metallo-hydrolase [Candidatus Omnitrophota bacterium]MBU1134436.1 MBL fold metallo-hydrolase [Candidatus Omnitrophota bacterium]MBU1367497.1 MBL fold metallo-hydrolase [Candidatus Omnitrophota bacterium]MBU1523601.1 MBL fold metallo-hydrolase [Candidatus Omnitrophota bacterium]
MRIKIIFDKDTKGKKLHVGWGTSFLIDDKVLFDTGEKEEWLIDNIERLKVDIDKIEAVVISHQHWDHTNGLWELLKRRKGLKVYVCPHFTQEFTDKVESFGGRLMENMEFCKLSKNIYVTGEIVGKYKQKYIFEQAAVVKTEKGITVITGCAHPGIIKILDRVREKFPKEKFYLVFGGFHLMDRDKREVKIIVEKFKEMGIEKAGPTHCTDYDARMIFKAEYKSNYMKIKVGQIFQI